MANYPYQAPGISITEISSPSTTPLLGRPTTIAFVGEAQNFLASTEIVLLDDSTPVALKRTGVNLSSLVVQDALNPLVTYTTSDYITSTDANGVTTIARSLYTTIPNNTPLVVVMNTTSPTGVPSSLVTLSGGSVSALVTPPNGASSVTSLTVQSVGQFTTSRDTDVTVTSTTATIARKSSSTIVDGQTVYVHYTTGNGTAVHTDALTLNTTNPQHLTAEANGVDVNSILVFNSDPREDATLNGNTASVVTYSSGNTNDYIANPTGGSFPAASFTLQRSVGGPTSAGLAANRVQVKVSYQATPRDFYQPTHVFSPSDVEAKYGLSIDSNGNVNSPLSYAALAAFNAGAGDVWVQPVFHSLDGTLTGVRTAPSIDNKTSYLQDWSLSISALRDLDDVNVVVPIISHTNITTLSDSDVLAIFQKVQTHINTQNQNGVYVVGIYGEDSTSGGRASQAALQAHAQTLAAGFLPERQVLASPASFDFPNPTTSLPLALGGQYVAAIIAGMLAGRGVADTLTRKALPGVQDVNDFRSKIDKDADASSGLLVVENNRGRIQIRHAITTAVGDPNTRELSVIRSKFYMLDALRTTLDTQIIGQIVVDSTAPHTVRATVQGVLETLMASDIIVGYTIPQARTLGPTYPSTIEVRFSYQPAYPLNYINIIFNFDVSGGIAAIQ